MHACMHAGRQTGGQAGALSDASRVTLAVPFLFRRGDFCRNHFAGMERCLARIQ